MVARLQAEDAGYHDLRSPPGFGGAEFWDALRQARSVPVVKGI